MRKMHTHTHTHTHTLYRLMEWKTMLLNSNICLKRTVSSLLLKEEREKQSASCLGRITLLMHFLLLLLHICLNAVACIQLYVWHASVSVFVCDLHLRLCVTTDTLVWLCMQYSCVIASVLKCLASMCTWEWNVCLLKREGCVSTWMCNVCLFAYHADVCVTCIFGIHMSWALCVCVVCVWGWGGGGGHTCVLECYCPCTKCIY